MGEAQVAPNTATADAKFLRVNIVSLLSWKRSFVPMQQIDLGFVVQILARLPLIPAAGNRLPTAFPSANILRRAWCIILRWRMS
jgi:hypothetical protein